jgi:hypothetical protein
MKATAALFLLALAVVVATIAATPASPAFAAVHCMRIQHVLAGVNGDTTIQAVELRMSISGQVFTNGSQLHFYNSAGVETGVFTLNANVANGAAGASILIGTAAFDAVWPSSNPSGVSVDFVMPENVMAPSGKVLFGPPTGGNCVGETKGYDSVAYGTGYTGGVEYPPAFDQDLPTSGIQALRLKATQFDTDQDSNLADYEIANNPTFCKNQPTTSPVCGTISSPNDDDADGVPNTSDLCPGTASGAAVDANGCSQAQVDSDLDGVCNPGAPSAGPAPGCTGSDNCPNNANPSQTDTDGDGQGDACDADDDNDTVNDVTDNCPLVANANQANNDGDSLGDVCDPDDDNDTVNDATDNCPLTANAGQENFDGDALGDACDADADNDGYTNLVEGGAPLCANSANDDNMDDGLANDGCPASGPAETNCADSSDSDGDGLVNDGCPQSGTFNESEFKIGTNVLGNCGAGSTPAPSPSWPSDFVSGGIPDSTDAITLTDITSFVAPSATKKLNTSPGQTNFNMRWDISPGPAVFAQWINLNDITSMVAGPTGFPPMFGGAKAFGAPGPTCTGP